MPNRTTITYLENAYKILEENIKSADPYKNIEEEVKKAEDIDFTAVWQDIDKKIKEYSTQTNQNKLAAFEDAFKSELVNFKNGVLSFECLEGLNEKNLNKLLINPKYKGVVTHLTKKINADKHNSNNEPAIEYTTAVKVSTETAAINLIRQQLQEFIQLSRLTNYISYKSTSISGVLELKKYRSELEILGAMNKLQFFLAIDNLKEFFRSYKEENQEIKSIVTSIFKYLDQAASANKVYYGSSLAFKMYGTNLEAVKQSFSEDKESLQNAFDVYLNNVPINQSDDEFFDAEEENNVSKKYDHALSSFEEGEEDDDDNAEFFDALEEEEELTNFSVLNQQESNPTTNFPKKDNNPINLERILFFLELFFPIFILIENAILITNKLISFLEKIKKNTSKVTPLSSTTNANLLGANYPKNSHSFFGPNVNEDEQKIVNPLLCHVNR